LTETRTRLAWIGIGTLLLAAVVVVLASRHVHRLQRHIELQRLNDVVYVESPAFGQEHQAIQLFKLQPNGEALRTTVKLGVRSVQFVQIVDGLRVGDEVVLSDMSPYDAFDRVRIN
jgi:hypothetical protein